MLVEMDECLPLNSHEKPKYANHFDSPPIYS